MGLFSDVTESVAHTNEMFTYGFEEDFSGGVQLGPITLNMMMKRGDAIHYDRAKEIGTIFANGLSELNPEVAVLALLQARGKALGLLYVDSRQVGKSASEDDVLVVLALAEQASFAIDNARLYEQETRKREAAEALRDAVSAFAGSLRLTETLSSVLEWAVKLFKADAAGIYELQPDGRTLGIRSAVGLPSEYILRAHSKIGAGITGNAVLNAELISTSNINKDNFGGGSRYTRQLLAQRRYPYKGVVSVPLINRGATFGALTLYWKENLPLSDEDLAHVGVFAAQASLAIENARQYEEELQREKEAAVLFKLGRLLGEDQSGAALAEAVMLATVALCAGRGLIALIDNELGNTDDPSTPSTPTFTLCATYKLYAPNEADLQALYNQLGKGPRPLSRRYCLPVAGSGLIVPLFGGPQGKKNDAKKSSLKDTDSSPQGVIGFMYIDDPNQTPPDDRALQLARSIADQISVTLTRERLLAALEQEEARYRQLAEGAHDLILSTDTQGTITYANPAATRLLEKLTGPLVGANLLKLPTPDTQQELYAAWDATSTQLSGGRAEIKIGDYRLEIRLSTVGAGSGTLMVARDISQLQTLAAEIARSGEALADANTRQSELRTYLSLFTQAQEEERKRISRELHDDTAQVLTASTRRVARLAKTLEGDNKDRANDILNDLNAALDSVRRFARNLRPSVLDDLGLLPALEWLASQARTETRLEVSGPERRLNPAIELTIFRLAQEALNNVDKHAGANTAAIRVSFLNDGVQMAISDDGVGFTTQQAEAQAKAGHLGLLGLRERVKLAGGELEVQSKADTGTTLTFSLPS